MVSIQLPKGRKFGFHTRIQPPSTDIVQDVRSLPLSETLPSVDRDRGCQTSPGNRGQEAPSRRRICWIHSCLLRPKQDRKEDRLRSRRIQNLLG
ncbi:hypothetical protein I314_04598 [Cryptococcus bacillisporus CA1873]|uniref:Uncharacterized protein n=2 Tax=Cryptococcus gattii TaxID=552467 RepID=A0A0D0TIH0_CRYGA|nr:hypothetical protein I312_04359 [Cryptococcus bacillisporus CA1280]KIR59603.1 hypothetical protein I314_04598 [Cryptococcus bacillisporus CA1873]|eukprot:KIR59603.1 hypothetical protein I314_04598 [Cryptococcus gattii CA1873]